MGTNSNSTHKLKHKENYSNSANKLKPKDNYYCFRLLIVGNTYVGKTAILDRYVDGRFKDSYYFGPKF